MRRRHASQSDEEEEDQQSLGSGTGSVDPFSDEEQEEQHDGGGQANEEKSASKQKNKEPSTGSGTSDNRKQDEDPTKNPRGRFFMHDDRFGEQNAREKEIYDPDGKPRVSRADKGVWLHDRFDQNTQSSRRRERRKKSEERYEEKSRDRKEKKKEGKTKLVYLPKGSSGTSSVRPPTETDKQINGTIPSETTTKFKFQPKNEGANNHPPPRAIAREEQPVQFQQQTQPRRTVRYSSKHQQDEVATSQVNDKSGESAPPSSTTGQQDPPSRDRAKSLDRERSVETQTQYSKKNDTQRSSPNPSGNYQPHQTNTKEKTPRTKQEKPRQTYVPIARANESPNTTESPSSPVPHEQQTPPTTKEFSVLASTPSFTSFNNVNPVPVVVPQYQYMPGMYNPYSMGYQPYPYYLPQEVYYSNPTYVSYPQTEQPVATLNDTLPPRRSHAVPITAPPKPTETDLSNK